ncbi:Pro-Hyp dipeptidase. Metallo peptidase. MEROPS family M38 [Saccharopolyspora shandongensis]|uniref:Pro-Hyp dipeptidase. Metallo peptidase. MEROPS family M38 n=1 Tax=Saccharopolyspora shandongensis TaxID=418495 RepID=A0A1H2WIJ2_9PSEU|nr:amidohydrolase family protein [Saccharopolyspora shandongensis]SDW80347.1 Pro-Hyp dipeptidase. Metallo peptidase. MEROPS family M38 [Saccharopolyspora shandongensis]
MTALHLRAVVLPDGAQRQLWVQDGRISLDPVPGAETVFDGGFVLPGLVDAHCHVGIGPEGPVELDEAVAQAEADRDAGTLLIRDCGAPVDTRSLQEREDLPRIIRAGKHLARPKRYIPYLADQLDHEEQLPAAVAEQVAYGDGWIKLVGDWIDRSVGDLAPLWSDEVLAEAIATAHRLGARVTAHVFGEDALPGLINAGIDCIEHGTGLTDDTIELMARNGTALVPTLINIENFPSFASAATKYPAYAAHMTDLYERADRTVAKAIEAGIPVYAGTDAGGGIEHGLLADEVRALHRVGMSTEQALGAASWAAREWLGWSGLQHGAAADLVCYDADPRKDLSVLDHPTRIVLRGNVVG